jgi:hypothetical protein
MHVFQLFTLHLTKHCAIAQVLMRWLLTRRLGFGGVVALVHVLLGVSSVCPC